MSDTEYCSVTKKRMYLTWQHATNDAHEIARKYPRAKGNEVLQPYSCRHCGRYHVGSGFKNGDKD